jgi:hypothetical protein
MEGWRRRDRRGPHGGFHTFQSSAFLRRNGATVRFSVVGGTNLSGVSQWEISQS